MARVARAFGAGMRVENDFEGDDRPFRIERFEGRRMQLAEPADRILRAELQRRGTAGMQKGGAAGNDLHRRHRDAQSAPAAPSRRSWRRRHRRSAPARPMAARACRLGLAAPQGGGGDALIVFAVAEEDLADFEQADVALAAPRVALRCRRKAGDQARPHVGEIGRDRIGERQGRRAAAEQFGLGLRDERPCHGLAQAERAERAFGQARALLQQRQHRLRHADRKGAAAGARRRDRGRRCARSARRCRPCRRCRDARSAR